MQTFDDLFGQPFTINDDDLLGGNFENLPKGRYRVMITGHTSRERSGYTYLVYEAVVIEGPYQNRKIWLDFTTQTPVGKEDILKYSMDDLKRLLVACGKREHRQIEAVINTTPVIELTYRKAKKPNEDGEYKEFVKYFFLDGKGQLLTLKPAPQQQAPQQPMQQMPQEPQPAQYQQPAPQQATENVPPPWAQQQ